ncbi:MAG: glutaredoxin family protein [Lysobacterales bacterium]
MFLLYGRTECELCGEAWSLIQQAGLAPVCEVDIDADAELGVEYGLRIPVLQAPDGRQLAWPFDLTRLQDFLRAP